MLALYENIRRLRQKRGMSQDELAKLVGYGDRTSIAKIESGKVDLPQSKIVAFANALQCSPAYLMGWTDEFSAEVISLKEQTHIKKYRLLNEDGQTKTDDYMDDLLKVDQYRAGEKGEFSKPLAPDPIIDYDAAIEEGEAEIARTHYARLAAYGGKNIFIKENHKGKNKNDEEM